MVRVNPPVTRLIKCDLQTDVGPKWIDFVDGGNGCFYGIPSSSRRVLQFKRRDKSIKEVGPDLGKKGWKYVLGIKANDGCIYCMPAYRNKYVLKIIPGKNQDAEVQILKDEKLPRGDWRAGALANDGCIYLFPYDGSRILKFDPEGGHKLSIVVHNKIGGEFNAAVLAKDGSIYGISKRQIIIFNPENYSVSIVDLSLESCYHFFGAVMAGDDSIYTANQYGQILKVDTTTEYLTIIGNRIYSGRGFGWGCPVLGADKNIYFPPSCHDQVLKFNPRAETISLVGDSYNDKKDKWVGAVASNKFIYCIPCRADNILQIDSCPKDVDVDAIGVKQEENSACNISRVGSRHEDVNDGSIRVKMEENCADEILEIDSRHEDVNDGAIRVKMEENRADNILQIDCRHDDSIDGAIRVKKEESCADNFFTYE